MKFTPILECSPDVQSAIRDIRNLEGVRRYMYTDHVISEDEHTAWLASLKGNDRQAVFVVMEETPLGIVSINAIERRHARADWAFYLGDGLRGKGIGAKVEFMLLDLAFGEFALDKLNCEVLETNPAVVKMHKRFGFVEEGFRRENILKDGKRIGVHFLGITKNEWLAHRASMVIAA